MKYLFAVPLFVLLASPAAADPKLEPTLTEATGFPVYVIRCKAGAGCLKDIMSVCGMTYKILAEAPIRAMTYGPLRVSNNNEVTVACTKVEGA